MTNTATAGNKNALPTRHPSNKHGITNILITHRRPSHWTMKCGVPCSLALPNGVPPTRASGASKRGIGVATITMRMTIHYCLVLANISMVLVMAVVVTVIAVTCFYMTRRMCLVAGVRSQGGFRMSMVWGSRIVVGRRVGIGCMTCRIMNMTRVGVEEHFMVIIKEKERVQMEMKVVMATVDSHSKMRMRMFPSTAATMTTMMTMAMEALGEIGMSHNDRAPRTNSRNGTPSAMRMPT
mmetsp:Transcript_17058/g.30940  ORF Transcript_17058/g.30940 Transcript_17058/m.30940 type:complete len:238 (+) Transcript_17058:1280-1993(+)